MYIKRKLSKDLHTFKNLCFPFKNKIKSSFSHQVTVGIGGNVGDVKRRFEQLFYYFNRDKRVHVVKTGLILKNPPFGYIQQEDFFNSIIVLQTDMLPFDFLAYLMKVEKIFGRKRSFENAPRTLDLDIIFYDKRVIKTKKLTVPHHAYKKRESVMIPLEGISK
jgi:2-amino-4-hydroxy-6-hydroxymethyldihydropteridine diphosphokinase